MKNIILLVFLTILIYGCSASFSDISKKKIDYVNDAIICDSKTTKFQILKQNELAEFFDSEEFGSLVIEYEYLKKGIKLKRKIHLTSIQINDSTYYMISFDRYAFPMSECRGLKNNRKYFK